MKVYTLDAYILIYTVGVPTHSDGTLLNPAHSFTRTRTSLTQTPAVTTALSRMNESANTTFSSGMLDSEANGFIFEHNEF